MIRMLSTWSPVVVVVAVALAGCHVLSTDQGREWFVVHNATDTPVAILYGDAEVVLWTELPPGGYASIDRQFLVDCTDRDLIARDLAGAEVARKPPPVCQGDTWTVE